MFLRCFGEVSFVSVRFRQSRSKLEIKRNWNENESKNASGGACGSAREVLHTSRVGDLPCCIFDFVFVWSLILWIQFHLWYFLSWEIHIKFYSNLDLHKLDPRLVHRKGCSKNYLELNKGIFIEWSDETKILFLPDYEFWVRECSKVVCCSIYTVPTGVHMYKCAITAENRTMNRKGPFLKVTKSPWQ